MNSTSKDVWHAAALIILVIIICALGIIWFTVDFGEKEILQTIRVNQIAQLPNETTQYMCTEGITIDDFRTENVTHRNIWASGSGQCAVKITVNKFFGW